MAGQSHGDLETMNVTIKGIDLTFTTHPSLFSPRKPDAGTMAMLQACNVTTDDRVLDLGCGYGLVGIYAAKIVGDANAFLIDVDPVATDIAEQNARRNNVSGVSIQQSDGFRDFRVAGFTKILSNPPYHADFSVPKHFILKGFNRLEIGGEMWFVTKRSKWYQNKLRSTFGNVETHQIDGYHVFRSIKKQASYARR